MPATALPAVGRLLIEFTTPMPLERVQRENPGVLLGGRYAPPDCTPAQTVAVIIPFRHREHHLRYWLHYLHPILRRQRLRYGVYVINQVRCRWPRAGSSCRGTPEHLWVWAPTWGWEHLRDLVCRRLCGCTAPGCVISMCTQEGLHAHIGEYVHAGVGCTDGCVHGLGMGPIVAP